MARKLNKNVLALSSAAIISLYAVGLARTAGTSASASSTAAPTNVASVSATQAPATSASTAIAQAVATTSAYKDGTYTGTGTSRMGDVNVAVTIQGGKITAVQITGGTTHYPLSRIAQLPGEVVAAQGTNIKLVSGATYSSQAFKDAVSQALTQAATA